MRLDWINIQNIRSIKNLELEFQSSTLLFYGDIGCGKSSVLKAIEFALFGTLNAADLKGGSLLRRSENKASVELAFTVDDTQYIIKRGLSRSTKGTISQPNGSLLVDEVETSYSVTDLRRKILEILNYSITRYEKAQKIPIYRYTVYTPQESVKEILQADPNDRFEILKDVFGIEKYEIALKNIDVINAFIRDKIKEYRGRLKEIGDPEENIPIKEEQLTQQEEKIKKLEKQIRDKEVETENAKKKILETQKRRDILSKQLIEIQNKEKNVSDDSKTLDDSERNLGVAQKGMITYEKELKKIPEISIDFEENKEELNKAIKDKRNDISKEEKQVGIFEKAKENREKLLKEGKCSLCGQEIHEEDRFKKELKEVNETIETLTTDIDECKKEIQGLEKKKEDLAEYSQNKAKREMYEKLIEGEKKREKELKIQIEELKEKIEQERNEISETLKNHGIEDLEKLKQVEKQTKKDLKGLQTVFEKKQSELNVLKVETSAENKSLEYIKKELEGLKQLIKKKESLTQKIESFTVLRDWIKDKLLVLIRDIEREILSSSARQFNDYFIDWFHLLVEEENIAVEIRPDDFEPIIMVNGYESPFFDMSGGEKSALSLAYRLALNKIINQRYQEVKTKDLLILDEPTDGFSQQQVNKMQELFDSLNTQQLIIISHDRALDSFVTDIFNFEKKNHETKVNREKI